MFISRFTTVRKRIVSASERDKFNSSLQNCTNGISYSEVLDLHGQGCEGCNKVDILFNTKSSEKGCDFYISSNSFHQCFILMFFGIHLQTADRAPKPHAPQITSRVKSSARGVVRTMTNFFEQTWDSVMQQHARKKDQQNLILE